MTATIATRAGVESRFVKSNDAAPISKQANSAVIMGPSFGAGLAVLLDLWVLP